MKKLILLTLMTALVTGLSAQTLTIDTDKAVVSFNYVKHETKGYVQGITGEITFNVADLTQSVIQGTADVKTISTDNKQRDEHLMQSDYFNAAKYPTMTFKSTSITATETGYKMLGMLKIKDIEKEVEFNFTFNNNLFEGKATIYSNDYGIASEKKREDSKILLKVSIPVL